jgi:hypothetical protein
MLVIVSLIIFLENKSTTYSHDLTNTIVMENYNERKFKDSYNYIKRSVFKEAIKKLRAKGTFLKMLHGDIPARKYLTKIKLAVHSECPCCL